MRPIVGIVVGCTAKVMTIELDLGNTIHHRPVDGITRGSVVEVDFDFTRSRVNSIRLIEEEPKGEALTNDVVLDEEPDEQPEEHGRGALSFPAFAGDGDDGDVPWLDESPNSDQQGESHE